MYSRILSRRQMTVWCITLSGALALCIGLQGLLGWGRTQLDTGAALAADTLRLHIRAASDAVADQSAKLRVRDAVLSVMQQCPAQSAPEARAWVAGRLLQFQLAAQRALAESLGLRSVPLAALAGVAPAFDTVVNTIPAVVFTEPVLAALRPGSLIVDLASRPGGTDFEAARRLGHRAIHALSLPAACAPETAGEAVAQTVCDMIGQREEAS